MRNCVGDDVLFMEAGESKLSASLFNPNAAERSERTGMRGGSEHLKSDRHNDCRDGAANDALRTERLASSARLAKRTHSPLRPDYGWCG